MWWLLFAPVGGLVNRMRGGLCGDLIRKVYPGYGVQCARALFGLATAGFACLLAPELSASAMVALKGLRPIYGVTDERAVFALGYVVGPALVMPLWLWLAAAIHLGLVMGWFKAADLGRDKDRPRLVEAAIMTVRGLLMTAPVGALLWGLGYGPWFLATGGALGLLYELGHRTPVNLPNLHQGMEVGEAYTGVWLWLALGLVLS